LFGVGGEGGGGRVGRGSEVNDWFGGLGGERGGWGGEGWLCGQEWGCWGEGGGGGGDGGGGGWGGWEWCVGWGRSDVASIGTGGATYPNGGVRCRTHRKAPAALEGLSGGGMKVLGKPREGKQGPPGPAQKGIPGGVNFRAPQPGCRGLVEFPETTMRRANL